MRHGGTALLDVWPIFEAFQLTYVSKSLLLEQEEKRLRALADRSLLNSQTKCNTGNTRDRTLRAGSLQWTGSNRSARRQGAASASR